MGLAPSTPADRIAAAASAGDARALSHLLASTRCGANQADRAGVTPLVHAAAAGWADAVAVLLGAGAAVNAAAPGADGATALHAAVGGRHVAAVDALLSAGACPFIENGRGQTAVDAAVRAGDAGLARRLEAAAADFAGDLAMKVPRLLGLGAEWRARYVVVAPRYACPLAGGGENGRSGTAVHRRTLFAFKAATETAPVCRLWLDGSAARPGASRPGRPHTAELTLHPAHAAPAGAHTTTSGRRCGHTLHFRAAGETAVAAADLARFVAAVNAGHAGAAAAAVAAEAAARRVADTSASDVALARRLQAEEDAAAAAQAVAAYPSAPARPAVTPTAPALPPSAWPGGRPSPALVAAAAGAPGDGSSWRPASRSPSPAPADRRPGQVVPAPAHGGGGEHPDDRAACAICLSAPARVGFLHGDTIHRCCCNECARAFRPGGPCPLCRLPVEKICLVF